MASTLFTIVGTHGRRRMHRHSRMLLHEPALPAAALLNGLSTMRGVRARDLADPHANLQALERDVLALYEAHTRLRGDALAAELQRETWLDAPTCLAYGLVDEVLGQERLEEAAYFSHGLLATEGQAAVAVVEVMEEANVEEATVKEVKETKVEEATAAVAKVEAVEEAVPCDAFDDVATVEAVVRR